MSLPSFDPTPLLRLAEQAARYGDATLVRDVVEDVIASLTAGLSALRDAMERGDLGDAHLHAHRLKSVFGQVGLVELADLATRIEALATQRDDGAWALVRALEPLEGPAVQALQAHLTSLGTSLS